MTTTGVLFDLDGVLVDSAALHLRAYEHVFRNEGLGFPDAARKAVFEGQPRASVLDIALPRSHADLKRRLSEAKPEALKVILADEADCGAPGAKATVDALGRAGVPIGIVTNSRAPDAWIEKLGIRKHLRAVVTGDDVSAPKPSPEGYLMGANRLGILPSRCLAVEDSRDGWLAATRAGMRVILVADRAPYWISDDTEVLQRLDPDWMLRRLRVEAEARP
jgi:HAD superfamily hydrolase (TIGR01509 family)